MRWGNKRRPSLALVRIGVAGRNAHHECASAPCPPRRRAAEMARSLLVPLVVAANLLIPVAILVFARGFFPYKPFIPGLAQYEPLEEFGDAPGAPFDRLIFMVVDALRRYVACLARRPASYYLRDNRLAPSGGRPWLTRVLVISCIWRTRASNSLKSMAYPSTNIVPK